MKFRWKKSQKPTSLMASYTRHRHWELHVEDDDYTDVIAFIYPVTSKDEGHASEWYVSVVGFKNIQHYNSAGKQTWTDLAKLKHELLASIKRKLAEIPTEGDIRLSWRRRKLDAGAKGKTRYPVYWELWYEGVGGTDETWVAAVFPKHVQGESPKWWIVIHPEHGLPAKNTSSTQVWPDVEKLKENVKQWVAKRIRPCK